MINLLMMCTLACVMTLIVIVIFVMYYIVNIVKDVKFTINLKQEVPTFIEVPDPYDEKGNLKNKEQEPEANMDDFLKEIHDYMNEE